MELADRLSRSLPDGIVVQSWNPGVGLELFREERAAVERAVEARRLEFARGRNAARAALLRLGGAEVPLPVGEDRAPVWPGGFVGSITHCGNAVLAAVARSKDWAGLGIDLERAAPLPDDVGDRVLHPEERQAARLTEIPEALWFSAKECVHKALFPLSGHWLDFHDVRVEPHQIDPRSPGSGSFRVEPAGAPEELHGALRRLKGLYLLSAEHILTAAVLASDS